MRILRVDDSVRPPSLIQDDAPRPRPGRGELLIRVGAAGVILTELSWYPTSHHQTGEARTGAVPGHEFSGVIQRGERVLIHGGAGAVGGFAIQFARLHGAHVIATASARNSDFVSSLGAGHVIDYRETRFENCVKDVDVVFDTVGGETLERSWSVLKPGGRVVTVVSTAEKSTDARVKQAFFIVEPNQKQLVEVGALLDAGLIRPVVDAVIPLSEAADAYSGKTRRRSRGKLVVEVTNMDSKGNGNGDSECNN